MTRYLILGNGAAGATAAEAIRQRDPRGEIILVSPETYPMYSRPGLAYVLMGEVPPEQVFARRLDWYKQLRLRMVHGAVAKLDLQGQRVQLADGQFLPYDRLLIATGARAVPLPYPGSNLTGVGFLDTLDGTKQLMKMARSAKHAVVVGGGITAMELAEGLAHLKVDTHYFVRKDSLWSAVFNQAESALLAERMQAHDVHVHFNTEVAEVLGDKRGRVKGVKLTGPEGKIFTCDLVGAGIGVKPALDFAKGTPLKMDRGLVVNEYLETNLPNVYAAGDVAQILDRFTNQHTMDVLWPTAVDSGRIAGLNMAGGREPYIKGTPFNACLLFGLHITAIGQLGGGRGEQEPEIFQHISRGSSEVWSTTPHAYSSAWSQNGPNTVRLALSGDRLAGALIVGAQILADPLRDLISRQINIQAIKPHLQQGGETMIQEVLEFWKQLPAA